MKVVLFCGGQGMRMRDYSDTLPKPMVPIGPRPILWHLMKYYAHFGHHDFVLCLGYKGGVIKEYFLDYREEMSNDFVLTEGGGVQLLGRDIDSWRITFVDTGLHANVGTRLWSVRRFVENEEIFLANYADGLSDLPLDEVIARLRDSDKACAFVTVRPSQTFHVVTADEDGTVTGIDAAGAGDLWVNGGFFVMRPRVFDYMRPGEELVEEPFRRMIEAGDLMTVRYDGFWVGMDTFKDRQRLDDLYAGGTAPWQVWRRGEQT
ncbi:MAG: glucose-1-phosphate cytidylyltransferase [Actinomyces sp.]|nr:MAG: glucose-1-phosphate cytidylyltransferase [Actinomyces sp.]